MNENTSRSSIAAREHTDHDDGVNAEVMEGHIRSHVAAPHHDPDPDRARGARD